MPNNEGLPGSKKPEVAPNNEVKEGGNIESVETARFIGEVGHTGNLGQLFEILARPNNEYNGKGERRYLAKYVIGDIKQAIMWKEGADESGVKPGDKIVQEQLVDKLAHMEDEEADALIDKIAELLENEEKYLEAREDAKRLKKWMKDRERREYQKSEEEIRELKEELYEQKEARKDVQYEASQELNEKWGALIPEEKTGAKKQEQKSEEKPVKKPWWKKFLGL